MEMPSGGAGDQIEGESDRRVRFPAAEAASASELQDDDKAQQPRTTRANDDLSQKLISSSSGALVAVLRMVDCSLLLLSIGRRRW